MRRAGTPFLPRRGPTPAWGTGISARGRDCRDPPAVGGDDHRPLVPEPAFHFGGETPLAVLDGFTIRNGREALGYGGGVLVNGASPSMRDCALTGCRANTGGGMFFAASSSQVTGCDITTNVADDWGGGMYAESCPDLVLTDCSLAGNTAAFGAGLYVTQSSTVTISGSSFGTNTPANSGGGIYCDGSALAHQLHVHRQHGQEGCGSVLPRWSLGRARWLHLLHQHGELPGWGYPRRANLAQPRALRLHGEPDHERPEPDPRRRGCLPRDKIGHDVLLGRVHLHR
jgi:hypothetical protein